MGFSLSLISWMKLSPQRLKTQSALRMREFESASSIPYLIKERPLRGQQIIDVPRDLEESFGNHYTYISHLSAKAEVLLERPFIPQASLITTTMHGLPSDKLIFVTGASGFLASHIIHELLKQGYRVRASARERKLHALRTLYKSNPSIEIVEIADIAHGNYEDVLQDVDAVIHTASPLPGRADVENMMRTAIDGSVNILKQAKSVGVKKFVITGSIFAVMGDTSVQGVSYRAEHWNPLTKEDASSGDKGTIYGVAKKYAELAIWEWAEANPDVDVTVFNPPAMYGSFAPLHLPVTPGDFDSISTNLFIYNLLFPNCKFPSGPRHVSFQDIAKAHVGALRTPASVQGRKRVLFSSPYGLDFSDALEAIRKARPELAGRLVKSPIPQYTYSKLDIDFARIEEVTGMKKNDFQTTDETILAAVDSIIEMENTWLKAGYIMPDTIPSFY